MHYKELLTSLGQCTPTEYEGDANHISTFIVPFEHEFYKDFSVFQKMHSSMLAKKWVFNNSSQAFHEKIYPKLKKNILDGIFGCYGEKEAKSFFDNGKALSFSSKEIPNDIWSFLAKNGEGSFVKKITFLGLDLWLFKEIGFFVYKISSKEDLNTISKDLYRNLRDFRALTFDREKKEIIYVGKDGGNINEFINQCTGLKICCDNKLSTYAKTINAINLTDVSPFKETFEQALSRDENGISFYAAQDVDVLMQATYLFATTSDFFPQNCDEPSDSYIHAMVGKSGIDIWKYWKGIVLHDTLSFVSYGKSGGGSIVSEAKRINYLLYIINLYTYFKLTQMDKLLSSPEFLDIDHLFKAREEVQILKNQFFVSKIATAFQPNEINAKIHEGLELQNLLEEVENNILQSYEFSKENYSMMITFLATVILVKDIDMPMWGYFALAAVAMLAYWQRHYVRLWFKKGSSFLNKKFREI